MRPTVATSWRPPDADTLGELAARLVGERCWPLIATSGSWSVRRPACGGSGAVARAAARIAAWVRGGRYGPFESPLLAPPSPMLLGPDDPRTPAVSVVVPVKSSHRCALLALHALARQDMAESYEIIACLAPGAPLAADIARQIPQIRLCLRGSDEGPGGGRNAGIAVARGEVVAFTDADCLADRTWLRSMAAAVRDRGGKPVRGWWQVYHAWSMVNARCNWRRRAPPGPGAAGWFPERAARRWPSRGACWRRAAPALPRGSTGPRRSPSCRVCRRRPARCGLTHRLWCSTCGARRLRGPGDG